MALNSTLPIYHKTDIKSGMAGEIAKALKSMEAILFQELSDTQMALQQHSKYDLDSLRNVATIQCALDILQSAKTAEEQATVYDILQHLKPASG